MKRLHHTLTALLLLFLLVIAGGCKHPYNEDITGSFPYLEDNGEKEYTIPAESYFGTFYIKTNVSVSSEIIFYENGDYEYESGWLSISNISYDSGLASVTIDADANKMEKKREADILFRHGEALLSIHIIQEAYTRQPGDEICNGDLELKTQNDVDNCKYTIIKGNLTITSEPYSDSEIYNLSKLKISEVEGNLTISNCYNAGSLESLSQIEVQNGIFTRLYSSQLATFHGKVRNATLNYISFENNLKNIKHLTDATTITLDSPTDLTNLDGIEELKNLKTLSIRSSNTLNDITSLSKSRNISTITISYCPHITKLKTIVEILNNIERFTYTKSGASIPQANYIKTLAEEQGKEDNFTFMELSGNLTLETPRLTNTEANSLEFASTASGFEEGTVFYFIIRKTGDSFSESFINKREATSISDEKTITLHDLEPDTEYMIYACAIDADGETYLSDPYIHKTDKITTFALNVNATFPKYETIEDYGDISTLNCYVYNPEYNVSGTYDRHEAENDGNNSFFFDKALTTGINRLFFNTLDNAGIGSRYTTLTDADGSIYGIETVGTSGPGCDLRMARTTITAESEQNADITLYRAVAKINIDTKFTQNVSSLDIEEITVTVKNLTGKAYLPEDGGTPVYDGTSTLVLVSQATSNTTVQAIATGLYTLPNAKGAKSEVEISLRMKDGSTKNSSTIIPQTLESNKFYNITFEVALSSIDNTFTIDQVEIVEDTIEF